MSTEPFEIGDLKNQAGWTLRLRSGQEPAIPPRRAGQKAKTCRVLAVPALNEHNQAGWRFVERLDFTVMPSGARHLHFGKGQRKCRFLTLFGGSE